MTGTEWKAAVAALAVALALPATAAAHDLGAGGPDGVPVQVERALGGDVKALDNGLYRVHSGQGFSYTTHGPDFGSDLLSVDSHGGSIDLGDPQRDIACATFNYQEVLYGYPTTGTNQLATKKADIQAMMKVINGVLNEESLASGGPVADFKVLCETDGSIKATAFPVTPDLAGGRASFTQIVTAAKAAGFGDGSTDRNVDFSIFYDGLGPSGACGTGYIYSDESPGAGNLNNNPGTLGGGYAASYDGCWFGRTPMHENAHNQGATQYNAPDSTGDGFHCNEVDDVMCYLDGGDLRQDYPQACPTSPGTIHYDCSWDTYFDSSTEAGEYLASNWNIGSSVNRFIHFGSPDVTAPTTTIVSGPAGPTSDSTPTFGFSASEPATFQCRFDGAAFAPCTGATSHTPTTPLGDGPHTFEVFATDEYTNPDATPDSRSFSVDTPDPAPAGDTTPPETTIDSGPAKVKQGKDAKFTFSSTQPGSTFECQLDNKGFEPCASPERLKKPKKGKHTFRVRATDAAGNLDPTPAQHKFKVKKKKRRH